ncbi:MAG TPA: DUF2171 domain-containing protein [Allosphingosinicella sp.]|nr:DUF2171 domain-containing protein [Allosphingosinicella sp.]
MDNRYGDDRDMRWRERGGRHEGGRNWDRDRDDGRGGEGGGGRGFMARAGEEVRSWFGGDDDHDHGRHDRSRETSYRDNQDHNRTYAGYGGTAGGWGNQAGDSWNQDRPGVHHQGGGWDREHSAGDRHGPSGRWDEGDRRWRGEQRSEGRDRNYGDYSSSGGGGGGGPEIFGEPVQYGTSGFGGGPDHGRRFDRVDPGHVGAQGAHPMSAPVGGGYAGGTGISSGGGYSSSARAHAIYQNAGHQQHQQHGGSSHMSGGHHDPHYSEWRRRQIESLDRDYDEYRREHQSRFEQDFHGWREKRGQQRQSMGRVTEHMEVVGSDGQKIGVVDKVVGDRIILTRNDETAGGVHHSIPCSWIENVEDKVTVNKSREEAMLEWRDEDRNRAFFEQERQGRSMHSQDRSFSGTGENR